VPDGSSAQQPRRRAEPPAALGMPAVLGTDGARGTGGMVGPGSDLAAIEALVDRLLPALTAKLESTNLGELEVREGDWRIRLRRPADAGAGSWNGELRRSSDKPSRSQPGHESHGHPRGVVEGHRGGDGSRAAASSNGSGPGGSHAVNVGSGPSPSAGAATRPDRDEGRRIATSPAVGVFQPSTRAAVGNRVREGDILGHVDVLGVHEEVVAPVDGIVAELIVIGGTAVEYGQELVLLRAAAAAEAR
jgi:biotin carboxyl carrier protein